MTNRHAFLAACFLVCGAVAVRADVIGEPIDLTAFSGMIDDQADVLDRDLHEVALSNGGTVAITPYVSGIVGGSFGTLVNGGEARLGAAGPDGPTFRQAGNFSQAMFTGGGAIGMAIDRPLGQWRFEVEGRARGPISGPSSIEG